MFDVIIPWRAGCPYRQLVLDWVVGAQRDLGRKTILGELEPDQPWVKADAVRAGLNKSTAEIVVIADGDVWCDGLELAVDAAETAGWAMPFKEVHRLSPQATSHALQTGDLGGKLEQRAYLGVAGGGMMAIQRDVYERVPMDPRFVGWGQEDEAWGAALKELVGPGWRGTAPLFHLWHPPQPRQHRATGSEESRHLRNRYFLARRTPGRMQAVIDEFTLTSPDM
jgi:hypothetical protein